MAFITLQNFCSAISNRKFWPAVDRPIAPDDPTAYARAPALMTDNVALSRVTLSRTPSVFPEFAALAPVIQYVAPASANCITPAPVVEHIASSSV